MKKFLSYITLLFGIITCLYFIGEWSYSFIYNHGSYRNKVMWVRDLKNQEIKNFDYIILGSSRAYYHLDPILIEEKTGKKGLNLGLNNSYPFEIKLMLDQFFKSSTTKKVFIQVDYTFNVIQPDQEAFISFIPYLNEEDVYNEFSNNTNDFNILHTLPFYRYQKYESQLGFRNILLSSLNKKPTFLERNGFKPIPTATAYNESFTYELNPIQNQHIKEILDMAKQREVDVFFFTAPMYQCKGNHEVFKSLLNNYQDFSELVREKSYFVDAIHLNEKGAKLFTEVFSNTYFSKELID